jgi:DNA polymerase-3 subunit alpha
MSEFVHLHGHSYHSNALVPDALSSPEDLVKRAKELGLDTICVTDHGEISAIPHLCKEAKKHGIKPTVGAELYVCDDPTIHDPSNRYQHLVALAMNWDGFLELLDLLSKANTATQFYYKPRNSYDQVKATTSLIFLTACAGGVLKRDDWEAKALELHSHFNVPGCFARFFVEIQPHDLDYQWEINRRAVHMHDRHSVPIVATQDFHYAMPGSEQTHEVLLAIGSKKAWSDPNRWRYPPGMHIRSMAEMVKAFLPHISAGRLTAELVGRALNAPREIATHLNFEWKDMPVSLPDMGADPERQLMELCIASLKERGLIGKLEYVERLQFEFETIRESGFLTYFLVLRDIINWSQKNGVMVGPGRGSSAGSLLCYLIGITQIDPLKHGLIFERFYRPGRIDLPDIDTDFEDERREEVLAYIRRRFGDEHVGGVASYTTFGGKGAIKDVARVFEIDHQEVNRATIQVDLKQTDGEEMVFEANSIKPLFAKYPLLHRFSSELLGKMRGTGQHAAGVVIAGVPLSSRAVISQKEDRKVVNWDKDIIESMGLMKLDVLGLRTLSILRNCAEHVFHSRGIKIDFNAIPLDDAKTLDIFQKGLTTGVFQFESNGMRQLLRSLKVDRFSIIADTTSLYRPGPMDLLPQYIAAQTGTMPIKYAHPVLEPILAETFGVLIYQEQLMRVFRDLAGFTYAEADTMRKIVGKKLGTDEFAKHEGHFISGAATKGVDEPTAKAIFQKMAAFAGYGFNKSHAVCYSVISFWCAYLKAHHPAEFYAAHISNSDDVQTVMAVEDALKQGIKVEMPDINRSDARRFLPLTSTTILAPLCAIRGMGEKAAELIVGARNGVVDDNGLTMFETREEKTRGTVSFNDKVARKGTFINGDDLSARIYKRIVNVRVMGALSRSGTLPWAMPATPEDLAKGRMELLGAIYREVPAVEQSELMSWDTFTEDSIGKVITQASLMARDRRVNVVLPFYGSSPRLMLVFDKPCWREAKVNSLEAGENYDVIRRLLKTTLGMNRKDFYVTSLFKMAEPPLGWDTIEGESIKMLAQEIDVLKPPVMIAFGKAPVDFFSPGSRVMESHGKIVLRAGRAVVLSKNPYSIFKDHPAAQINPETSEEFTAIIEALKKIY